jgi:hypothetical protein
VNRERYGIDSHLASIAATLQLITLATGQQFSSKHQSKPEMNVVNRIPTALVIPMLVEIAGKRGFTFDREAKQFVVGVGDGKIPATAESQAATRKMMPRPAKLSDRIGKAAEGTAH